MSNRESTVVGLICIFCAIVAAIAAAAAGYGVGYRNGQIDAANGREVYLSIETQKGTRWYRTDKPTILYERSTPKS